MDFLSIQETNRLGGSFETTSNFFLKKGHEFDENHARHAILFYDVILTCSVRLLCYFFGEVEIGSQILRNNENTVTLRKTVMKYR